MRLLTRETSAGSGSQVVLPRINLLPPEIGERQHLRRVQGGLGLGVLAALAVTGLLQFSATSSQAEAQGSLDVVTAEHAQLAARVAGFRDVTEVYARTEAAQAMLVEAMSEEVRYSRHLDDVSHTVPDRVWITDLVFSQQPGAATAGAGAASTGIGTLTATGTAYSYDDAATWLETLAGQEGYEGAALQSATERRLGGRTVVDFVTSVSLTAEALSDRYTSSGAAR